MNQKIEITSEELYVLGKILNAKYIDYAYIAIMKDIGSDYELFEKETISRLAAKGILEEDFSGNIAPTEETISMFTPVFFGQTESSLDICFVKDPVHIETYKFHFFDDRIAKITIKGNNLEIVLTDEKELKDFINVLFDKVIETGKKLTRKVFNIEDVTEYIAVKSNVISVKTIVETYIESEGLVYRENESGEIEDVRAEDFIIRVLNILRGTM